MSGINPKVYWRALEPMNDRNNPKDNILMQHSKTAYVWKAMFNSLRERAYVFVKWSTIKNKQCKDAYSYVKISNDNFFRHTVFILLRLAIRFMFNTV